MAGRWKLSRGDAPTNEGINEFSAGTPLVRATPNGPSTAIAQPDISFPEIRLPRTTTYPIFPTLGENLSVDRGVFAVFLAKVLGKAIDKAVWGSLV
jgi:hypothetical protein